MVVEYTLQPEDVAAARLLAIGIRPRLEFGLFVAALAALLIGSVSPWSYPSMPLLVGLTASLGGFRLMQIGRVRQAAAAAFQRNPTLRRPTVASWDDQGITIHPAAAHAERILWRDLKALRENERIVLLSQGTAIFHAIPKRAFNDKAALQALRRLARAAGHAA